MGKRLYQINNENVFSNITPMSAYWLGFFAADGYIIKDRNSIGIGLSERDIKQIEMFRDFIGSTHPIHLREKTKAVTFCINSTILKNDISKWIPAKTERDTKNSMISCIDDDYKDYFIAGYFDGDGSVFSWYNKGIEIESYAVTIVGNYNTLYDMTKHLSKRHSFRKLTIVKNDNVFRLAWGSKNDITEFSKIYFKSPLQLERKLIKYTYIIKELENKKGRKQKYTVGNKANKTKED
jgi:hypothetical protein